MRYVILIVLYIITLQLLSGQEISSVRAEVKDPEGRKVEISYVLEDFRNENATYKVDLYLRTQGKLRLLYSVSGDVGDSIKVGTHRIIWQADQEFSRYKGNISFEVRAVKNFMIFEPSIGTVMKRGTAYRVQWFGEGSNTDSLIMRLVRYDEVYDTLGVGIGKNQYMYNVPKRVPPNDEYQIHMYSISNPAINALSPKFSIRRQIPLGLQIGAGILAAGIGVALFLIPEGGGGNTDLPSPPPLRDFEN